MYTPSGKYAAILRLVPVVDLEVVWRGLAPAGLHELAETQQKGRPLHAAVAHELDRLAPAAMTEHDDRVRPFLTQRKGHLGADPLGRPCRHAPAHLLAGPQRHHVEHHAALVLRRAVITEAHL